LYLNQLKLDHYVAFSSLTLVNVDSLIGRSQTEDTFVGVDISQIADPIGLNIELTAYWNYNYNHDGALIMIQAIGWSTTKTEACTPSSSRAFEKSHVLEVVHNTPGFLLRLTLKDLNVQKNTTKCLVSQPLISFQDMEVQMLPTFPEDTPPDNDPQLCLVVCR